MFWVGFVCGEEDEIQYQGFVIVRVLVVLSFFLGEEGDIGENYFNVLYFWIF